MRVLVVEDHAELADDIADGLRDQGIGADVAYDGPAGIEKALMNSYDVVVLDRDLPKVHGDAVCATRSPTVAAAVSIKMRATERDPTCVTQTASPWTWGRSRSRTTTS